LLPHLRCKPEVELRTSAEVSKILSLTRRAGGRYGFRPLRCPSERLLDGGACGLGADRLSCPGEEGLVNLDGRTFRHEYILSPSYVHIFFTRSIHPGVVL